MRPGLKHNHCVFWAGVSSFLGGMGAPEIYDGLEVLQAATGCSEWGEMYLEEAGIKVSHGPGLVVKGGGQ